MVAGKHSTNQSSFGNTRSFTAKKSMFVRSVRKHFIGKVDSQSTLACMMT
jgi:hypothetical protein